jgi:hypothetical protein
MTGTSVSEERATAKPQQFVVSRWLTSLLAQLGQSNGFLSSSTLVRFWRKIPQITTNWLHAAWSSPRTLIGHAYICTWAQQSAL